MLPSVPRLGNLSGYRLRQLIVSSDVTSLSSRSQDVYINFTVRKNYSNLNFEFWRFLPQFYAGNTAELSGRMMFLCPDAETVRGTDNFESLLHTPCRYD